MKNKEKTKRPGISRLIGIGALIVLTWSLSSCSTHENTRQLSPSFSEARLANLRTFYVRHHADDDYGLAADVADELQVMGYQASHGAATKPARRVDAVLTYMDRWMWDITTYMLSLDVQLRDPQSDTVLASGKTVRTSLVRGSQKEMVRETLGHLLKKQ